MWRAIGTSLMTLVGAGGQSNMTDRGNIATLSEQRYAQAYPQVRQYSMQASTVNGSAGPPNWTTTNWQALQPITWNGSTQVGLLASAMQDLDHASSGAWATARVAIDGSSMVDNWDPASGYPTSTAPPNLCNTYINTLIAAKTAVGAANVVGLWNQGETDALSLINATAYEARLTSFINTVRASALGAIPFVIVQLNAEFNQGTPASRDALRASQAAVCAALPNCYLVNVDSITIASGMYDGLHYTANGYIALGHLVSPVIAAAIGLAIPPTSSFVPTLDLADPLTVDFTDTSSSPGETITTWAWDFGDSGTSALQSPSHTYAGNGPWTVTLTTTNTAGLSNTTTLSINVGGITGVFRDPQKGWYRPATIPQWRLFLDAIAHPEIPDPKSVWGMQDAQGSATVLDTAGLNDLTVNVGTSTLFRQPVPGCSTLQMILQYAATAGLSTSSANLPSLATTSCTVMGFQIPPSTPPPVARSNMQIGATATRAQLLMLTSGLPQANSGSNVATGASSICNGQLQINTIQWNQSPAAAIFYTVDERLVPTVLAGTAGQFLAFSSWPAGGLGLIGGAWAGAALWEGYNFTQAQMRDIYEGLGPQVPW